MKKLTIIGADQLKKFWVTGQAGGYRLTKDVSVASLFDEQQQHTMMTMVRTHLHTWSERGLAYDIVLERLVHVTFTFE
jgi:hypothetical protein